MKVLTPAPRYISSCRCVSPDPRGRFWLYPLSPSRGRIANFSGAAAELGLFLDSRGGDTRDRRNIDEMIERFGLDWDERRLTTLRFDAQI